MQAIVEPLSNDIRSLLQLAKVNKLFQDLTLPFIYRDVDFKFRYVQRGWCGTGRYRALHRHEACQAKFKKTVEAKPQYLTWIKHFKWLARSQDWPLFSRLTAVRSVDIETWDLPSTVSPMFPVLEIAHLTGIFPKEVLKSILLPGDRIRELRLLDQAVS